MSIKGDTRDLKILKLALTVIETSLVLYLFPLPISFDLISVKDHDQLRNMRNKAHYYFTVKNNLVVSYGSLVKGNGIENK